EFRRVLFRSLCPIQPPALVHRVEAVALREELLERPRRSVEDLATRPVPRAEDMPYPRRLVLDPLALRLRAHPSVEVRQLVRPPRRLDGEPARCVEAEEPD